MAAEQRRLLEQLMGDQLYSSSANSSSKPPALSITDPKVCRAYVCGSCPHDLFTNTKQDLGPCPKTHLPNLKEEYATASAEQKRSWGLEFDYLHTIMRHVSECDRRIDAAQRRLEKTADEIRQTNVLVAQIKDFRESIEAGIVEVKVMAELGNVNEATLMYYKVRAQKVQKDNCERELKNLSDTSGPSGHQKLQVCDVCGAYLSRLDNDRRLADHFFGKMHLGFATMRSEGERLGKELKGRQPPPSTVQPQGGQWARGRRW
ncbi:LUC7-domain-containing protein [Piedraia hortae CBS 480.64]|uniref:LUC7-domain-containing protein n=1 Tax=Piedraia hortae CBS 480.64 TaxID=1314780 RepID=A0A6A7BYU4_9PEZI|nr:LUC7-domain-containing protein [Piedraia hortae CBS 480.64]